MNDLSLFVIHSDSSVLDALKAIDKNHKGFLVVVDSCSRVVNFITDGDIRRWLIFSGQLSDCIIGVIKNKNNFTFLEEGNDERAILEKFNVMPNIEYLPVLNNKAQLVNIISKDWFMDFLLVRRAKKKHPDSYSFRSQIIEKNHRVIGKPWGYYLTLIKNDQTQAKIINISPKEEISLQSHKKREEHWIVVSGRGIAVVGDTTFDIYPAKYIFIPKRYKHQLINNQSDDSLVLCEVQLGDYFGEDDIVRYSDKYNRSQ